MTQVQSEKRNGGDAGRPRRRRRRGRSGKPKTGLPKEAQTEEKKPERQVAPAKPHVPIRYGVVFYDTLAAARNDRETLAVKAGEVDQLNIVVRAEGDMDDPELLSFGKLYCGAAWTLIHERRCEEGWYEVPH